jgi:hypothetical protein
MSMKRSRAKSFSRGRRDDESPLSLSNKPAAPEKSWEEQVAGQADEAFAAYDMTAKYVSGAFINHAAFGKGVVLTADAQRIEVLFADGKRKLGHGIQP